MRRFIASGDRLLYEVENNGQRRIYDAATGDLLEAAEAPEVLA